MDLQHQIGNFPVPPTEAFGVYKDSDISQMFMVKKLVPRNQNRFIQHLTSPSVSKSCFTGGSGFFN